jgi:hypothetical protein
VEGMSENNSWKKITKELDRQVLVTNNIIIKSAEPDKYGKFTAFTDCDRRLINLTHYCEIPQARR